MKRLVIAALLVGTASGTAHAADFSLGLRLFVPQICYVSALEMPVMQPDGFRIERVREMCNSGGYQVVFNYTPDTLQGATVTLGGQAVTLDGSGSNVIVDTSFAVHRISELQVSGVDTSNGPIRVNLQMIPR